MYTKTPRIRHSRIIAQDANEIAKIEVKLLFLLVLTSFSSLSPVGVMLIIRLQDWLHTDSVAIRRSSFGASWLYSKKPLMFPAMNPFIVTLYSALVFSIHWYPIDVTVTLHWQSFKSSLSKRSLSLLTS